ncbi:MAG TPA: hypothetical protein VG099_06140, partial [Gemmataceae bacterium]|nr:hypothetical protein [Gemmataceae bacterium]
MSRAYRICVRDSVRQILRARDHVSTHLEVLNILPPEQTAALLEVELEKRGFKNTGNVLARQQHGVVVLV